MSSNATRERRSPKRGFVGRSGIAGASVRVAVSDPPAMLIPFRVVLPDDIPPGVMSKIVSMSEFPPPSALKR